MVLCIMERVAKPLHMLDQRMSSLAARILPGIGMTRYQTAV
jgi:hypothetical protein